ncbi:MAG: sulfotransferase domain-containing protein [Myxococcota bacterium]
MIRGWLRRWRYGNEVIIVSGLPRSGTSMMMKMLEAAELPIMTDGERTPDEDNPKGYYEYERVKNLEHEADKSYIREARGKVLKVISHLLRELPDDCFYRVIFMRRDLDEVIASQNKMLERRGEPNPVSDAKARELYEKHLMHVRFHVGERPNFDMIEVGYREALDQPRHAAEQVSSFLGGGLDVQRMAAAVDPSLYRNRRERL